MLTNHKEDLILTRWRYLSNHTRRLHKSIQIHVPLNRVFILVLRTQDCRDEGEQAIVLLIIVITLIDIFKPAFNFIVIKISPDLFAPLGMLRRLVFSEIGIYGLR